MCWHEYEMSKSNFTTERWRQQTTVVWFACNTIASTAAAHEKQFYFIRMSQVRWTPLNTKQAESVFDVEEDQKIPIES